MTTTTRRATLGVLASVPALALPAVAIASPGLSVAPVLAPAAVPENPPLPAESDEFRGLVNRFSALFDERNEAWDQEKVARIRFAAEAPLRPKKPHSKYPHVRYDIVREEPSFDDTIQTLKGFNARKDKSEKPSLVGLRFKRSAFNAYHDLIRHPSYTKEGEQDRKLMGVSGRWEEALRQSACETGYEPALQRRTLAEKGMRELIPEILKQRPKTAEGLHAQAAICLADPDVKWTQHHNALALLNSVLDFGKAA
jgi:hypothetical protein